MNPNDADFPAPPPVPIHRQIAVLCAGLVGLALLGWIDFFTGYELGFFVFYSVPVGLTSWYAGRWPGLVTALGASLTWWLADHFNGVNYSSRFYLYWNLSIHFLTFVINAVSLAKIRSELDERRALVAELRRVKRLLQEAQAVAVPKR
ncbi:MAG: hypothetical protein H7343_18950 [Undibacterium sp.]|nr:hypothetical protein [Opitutaceae bacterium]